MRLLQWYLMGCFFLLMITGPMAEAASQRPYSNFRGNTRDGGSVVKHRHRRHLRQESTSRLRVARQVMEEKQDEENYYDPVNFSQAPSSHPSSRPTTSPTIANIFTPNDDQEQQDESEGGFVLLPFMLQVEGTHLLGSTNELLFRSHLQGYLLSFFLSPMLEVSTIIESIRMDRPWVTTTTNDDEGRQLQEQSTSATTNATTPSNLNLQYQGRAVLKDSAAFVDTQPTLDLIHEAQIVALEDTAKLQEYFIQLLFQNDDEGNNNAPGGVVNGEEQPPVVFVKVQVEGRPLFQLDPAVTWDRIEALNQTQSNGDQQQQQNNSAGGSVPNDLENETPASQNNADRGGLSATATAVVIGVTLVVCAIAGAIFCMLRAKRQRQMLRKLPGAPDVHAMEVVSDVDSEEHLDDIFYDKSLLRQQKNSSPTMTRTSSWCEVDEDNSNGGSKKGFIPFARVSSLFRKSSKSSSASIDQDDAAAVDSFPAIVAAESAGTISSRSSNVGIFAHGNGNARLSASSPVIDLTAPGRNSSGIEVIENEAAGATPRSVLSSPPPRQKASQEEHDELDSVVANMNLYSAASYDEESMMGYSLASNNESVAGNHSQHKQLNNSQETEVSILSHDGNISPVVHDSRDPPDLSRQASGGEDGDSSNSSDPSTQNSMLPGVQNLLNSFAKISKPKSRKKWYRGSKKNRPQGFFSSDSESVGTLEHVLEEVSNNSDSSGSVFVEDDADSVEVVDAAHHPMLNNLETDDDANSSYKEVGSLKESDSSVMSDMDHAPDMHGSGGLSALGYYIHNHGDKTRMLPQITPVPSEEMDETVLKTPVIANSGLGMMMSRVGIRDDVSDAPSDERNTNVAALAMQGSLMGPSDSVQHVPSVDSDPAVVDYLKRERRQRTRRKRAFRKQPPLTMEV